MSLAALLIFSVIGVNPAQVPQATLRVEVRTGDRAVAQAEVVVRGETTKWDPLLRPAQAVDGRWTVDAWAPLDGWNVNGGLRLRF